MTPTLRLENAVTSAPSPLPPSLTTTPPTLMPDQSIRQQCLPIRTEIQPSSIAEGTLILDGFDLLFLSLRDHKVQPVSKFGVYTFDAAISPDGSWLAFTRNIYDQDGKVVIEKRLSVVAVDGKIQKEITWENEWAHIAGWLDDEQLVIVPDNRPPGSVVILNPFMNQQEEFPPVFPDVYGSYPPVRWPTVAVYDPELARVAYFRQSRTKGLGIALWDLQSGRTLWELNSSWTIDIQPVWSPDGTQLAVSGPTDAVKGEHEELFIVSRDGLATQLTNLAATYRGTIIGNFSWSPDGRHIAFWLNSRQTAEQSFGDLVRLAVLDVTTKEIVDYCVTGQDVLSSAPPIWTLDSRQVIVESYPDIQHLGENTSRVILVDITKNLAVEVAKDISPIGWMKASP